MTKIAYDYQIFIMQKYGGVSRYFCELASAITNQKEFDVTVYAEIYQNKYLPKYSNLLVKGMPTPLPIPRRILGPVSHQLSKIRFNFDRPDIVHETYYSQKSNAPSNAKTIVTVFDMIDEKLMNSSDENTILETKAKSIRRADRIICISENTRKDLLEIFDDLDPNNVITVHLAHSPFDVANTSKKPIVSEPYILYVGDRSAPYKNFNGLIQAYANSQNLQNHFKLVFFGSVPLSSSELNIIKNIGIDQSNVLYYSGDDSVLANLYSNASVFVYPSLYEGFGIPPLEAMSLDCPVVCSNTSSIPEVVGNAGEYFDPHNIDSIIEAIEKVVFSKTSSQNLKQKGRERVKLFSWEKCAADTSALYRSLA